jgi:hypothetical protein
MKKSFGLQLTGPKKKGIGNIIIFILYHIISLFNIIYLYLLFKLKV